MNSSDTRHSVIDNLLCLKCGKEPSDFVVGHDTITCRNCGFTYPVQNGVPACLHPDDMELFNFSEIEVKDRAGFIKMKQKAYFEESLLQKLYIHYHQFAACQRAKRKQADTLDIGFGIGEHTRFIDDSELEESRFIGLDLDRFKLEFAKKTSPRLTLLQGTAFSLPFMSGSFDIVQMLAFLEHFSVSDLSRMLSETRRVLKDDGMLIACYPAEGGMLLKAGQKLMHSFLRSKTGCNIDEVGHVHKSDAFEIKQVLEQHFKLCTSSFYPFHIGSINLNLFVNETYTSAA